MEMHKPVIFSNCNLILPDFSKPVSVSLDVFQFRDKTSYKIFWQMEPDEITGIEKTLIKNHKFYDRIFTWSQSILDNCPNARLFLFGSIWETNPDMQQKRFAVSYLTSSKADCFGHKYRQEIFSALPEKVGELSITKHKSPPFLSTKLSMLSEFQFTIVIENAQHPNYFTEKLLDAFATKTIPIYWGAPNIGKFFNKDGILSFNTLNLMEILTSLTPEFYQSKMNAIEENFTKAFQYETPAHRLTKAIEEELR